MATVRLPRVERLLGVRALEDVEEGSLERLIDGSIGEDEDLDYKVLYAPNDHGRNEIAKDIAAFANRAGGLIIVGLQEDKQARAAALSPIDNVDAEMKRITLVTAEWVKPHPDMAMREVPAAAGGSYLLVAVARSTLPPHAVTDPSQRAVLRFPVRSGRETRWLGEQELADRCRDRFSLAQERIGRLEAVTKGLTSRGVGRRRAAPLRVERPGLRRRRVRHPFARSADRRPRGRERPPPDRAGGPGMTAAAFENDEELLSYLEATSVAPPDATPLEQAVASYAEVLLRRQRAVMTWRSGLDQTEQAIGELVGIEADLAAVHTSLRADGVTIPGR